MKPSSPKKYPPANQLYVNRRVDLPGRRLLRRRPRGAGSGSSALKQSLKMKAKTKREGEVVSVMRGMRVRKRGKG